MTLFKNNLFSKIFSLFTAVTLVVTGPGVSLIQAKSFPLPVLLPSPEAILNTSASYEPPMVRGMKIDADQGVKFSFLLDTGHAQLSEDELKAESEKIIQYFLASLTTSEDDLWVNLSPFEKDRITSEALYQTEMGRDLLGQDYILKKLTSSLLFPDNEAGKKFWDKVHSAVYEKFADTDVPVDTFHKIWIVPESVELFVEGDKVLIISSKLKVMLEEDYFSLEQSRRLAGETSPQNDENSLFRDESMKQALKEVVVPIIEEEVNHGEHFANLRQIFHAMILAKWFRQHFRQELLDKMETAKSEPPAEQPKQQQQEQQQQQQQQQPPQGQPPAEQAPDIEQIYQKYLDAFQAGSEGYIRQAYDPVQKDIVVRRYVTGGFRFNNAQLNEESDSAQLDLLRIFGETYEIESFFAILNPAAGWVESIEALKVLRSQKVRMAALQSLWAKLKSVVGGIDLKTDEMKVTIKGEGLKKSLDLKDNLVVDPTKIGRLIPTNISNKPLPSVRMFMGQGSSPKSN